MAALTAGFARAESRALTHLLLGVLLCAGETVDVHPVRRLARGDLDGEAEREREGGPLIGVSVQMREAYDLPGRVRDRHLVADLQRGALAFCRVVGDSDGAMDRELGGRTGTACGEHDG
jgi:hypothetical protein